jgi:hypothetical protein
MYAFIPHWFGLFPVYSKEPTMKMAYCDYIAHVMKQGLSMLDNKKLISAVGVINYDTDANGSFVSTKKSFKVKDMQGKAYTVTVEEDHA